MKPERRRDLFPLGESDATLNEERRAHWGGAGNYISTGARAVASAGRSYTSSNPFSGAHISYGGSSSGARGVYSAGRSYVSHGNPFSSGGGGSSAASAAAAQQAAAQQRAQAVAVQLQRNGVQLANDLSTLRSQASSGQQAAQAILSSIGLQHLGSQGLQTQGSVPALQSLKKPTAVPQAPLSQAGNAAAQAVAKAAPHNIGNPLGPAPKSLASVGAAAGQHAAPLVYQASLSPAKQQLLAQVTTQATAHDTLGAAAINARNQSLSAYNAQAAAHNAQGQAVANQLTQDNLRVGQSLIHPGADTNRGFWGPLNMKRYQPGSKPPSTSAPATASPITALTNLFGGGSKPNFSAIGAAAGQAVSGVPKAAQGLSTSGTISAAPSPSHTPQMASVRHAALTALNTAATNQVAANQALPAMTGHLGPNQARVAAHPARALMGGAPLVTPLGGPKSATAQRNLGFALALAKRLGANPMQLQALAISASANPKTLGNRILLGSGPAALQQRIQAVQQFVSKAKGVKAGDPVHLAQQVSGFGATTRYQQHADYLKPKIGQYLQIAQRIGPTIPKNLIAQAGSQGPAGVSQSVKDIFIGAAKQYGIDPAHLWGIYGIETNFGKNLSTSSAGAQGYMQFIPSTAAQYHVNVNDLKSSVYGAAHLLKSAGYQKGNDAAVRKAIFSYNHSTQYVNDVLAKSAAWNGGKGATGTYTPGAGSSSGAPSSAGSSSGVGSSSAAGSSGTSSATTGAGGTPSSTANAASAQVLRNNVASNLARYGSDLSTHLDSLKQGHLSAEQAADVLLQDLVANMRSGRHSVAHTATAPRRPSLPRTPRVR